MDFMQNRNGNNCQLTINNYQLTIENLPQGWFFEEDIKAYRFLAEQVPDGGSIIELGVWKGRSLCSIADIIIRKNLKVYAVDTFQGTESDGDVHKEAKEIDLQQVFKDNMKSFGIHAEVYAMTTNEAAKLIPVTQKFDLVFVDADHSSEAITQDLENWIPKCKGIIAGHDFEREGIFNAVEKIFPNVDHQGLVWWNDFSKEINMSKKIDVIIPAYKAQNTIERTLASIVMQSVVNKVSVVIVNDADGIGYEKFVNQFKDFMEIREITMDKNGGPGVARQVGIDNTTSPYFTCIDADDTFAGAFALQILLRGVEENPGFHTVVGGFAEHHLPLNFITHEQDLVWMFGKLYTRAFINKYNIRFNETRANEDNGFNTIIRLVSSPQEMVMFIPDIVYYWHNRDNSITRVNNCQYSYDQSFCGYTDNMIWAIQCAKKVKRENPYINMWAVQVMAQLYNYYFQTVKRDPRFTEQNYSYCIKYYKEVFAEVENEISKTDIEGIFAQTLSEQAPNMKDNVPDKTIYQFIEGLRDNCQLSIVNG